MPIYERRGEEFRANTLVTGPQYEAQVFASGDGGFIVIWTDESGQGHDTSWHGIRGQRFDAQGVKLGEEFGVNTTTFGIQGSQKGTALADGRFVVTWSDLKTEGFNFSEVDVRGQIFNADGTKAGDEFLVTTVTAKSQNNSGVVALAGGGFVATWTDNSGEGGDTVGRGVKAQIFDAAGAKVGGEFLVNTVTSGNEVSQAIAALPSGGFVASFSSGDRVEFQIFGAAGNKVGQQQSVNVPNDNLVFQTNVAVLPSGFVVTWAEESVPRGFPTQTYTIKAQLLNEAGEKVGGEILVDPTQTAWHKHGVVALPDGDGFIITWSSWADPSIEDLTDHDIYAQVYGADGVAIGAKLTVNGVTAGTQMQPTVATLASGDIVISWTDASSGAANADIKVQLLSAGSELSDSDQVLSGTSSDDVLVGGSGNDTIAGHDGDDMLDGVGGNDNLLGGDGADQLFGGQGVDYLEGGLNNDTLYGDAGNDIVFGGVGNDNMFGGDGDDYVDAGDGVDYLEGGLGNDALEAGAGNDVVFGGEGGDNLIGGEGDDYLDSGDGVDFLDGGIGNDALVAGVGDDVLFGGDGGDNLIGGGDNDYLNGGDGADYLEGGIGNDSHEAGVGDDVMFGGDGDDYMDGGGDRDYLNGGLGVDHLVGGAGGDGLHGGDGDDILQGGHGADYFDGGIGNDALDGGLGDDVMFGGLGGDNLLGGDGADYLDAGDGVDYLEGGAGNDALEAGSGNDVMFGGTGSDNLIGGDGDDYLNGGEEADYLEGNAGNDSLDGGTGSNILAGGEGADAFLFTVAPGGGNFATILDFTAGTDRIALTGSLFGMAPGGLPPGAFRTGPGPQDGDDRIIYNPETGALIFDADGSGAGAAVQFASLQAGLNLAASDFTVI